MTYLLIYSSNNSTYRCILIVLTVCYQDIYFQEKLQPVTYDLQPIIMKNDPGHEIWPNTFLVLKPLSLKVGVKLSRLDKL